MKAISFKSIATATAVTACCLASATGASAAKAPAPITFAGSGSTAAYPIAQPLFDYYSAKVDKSVKFTYNANGGNKGLADVKNGTSNFALQARLPLLADAPTVYVKAFVDGLCVAVNNSNKLTKITKTQVKDIFLGNTRSWDALSGSGLSGTIAPFGRDSAGGTYQFFRDGVLDGSTQNSVVTALQTDGEVKQGVVNNTRGISYSGLGWIGGGVKALAYDNNTGLAIPCDAANVKTFRYPLSRYIWFVLPSKNNDGATISAEPRLSKFINWVRTDAKAASIIAQAGDVALTRTTR
jgi:phosphate transport system substrate-binding protein